MKYRGLLWYGGLFVSIIVVILFEVSFFYSRILDVSARETQARGRIATLKERQQILASLSSEVLSKSNRILAILPSENATLAVSAQIRNAALENGILIKNLSIVSVVDSLETDYNSIQIAYVAEGPARGLITFLNSLKDFAPLMRLESVNVNVNTEAATAQVNMRSFWSALPSSLPSITESISDLTSEEHDILNEIDMYRLPNVAADSTTPDATPAATTINPDPFRKI